MQHAKQQNPKGKPLFEDDNSWKKAMGSKNSTMAKKSFHPFENESETEGPSTSPSDYTTSALLGSPTTTLEQLKYKA